MRYSKLETKQALSELDSILNILEAKISGNVAAPENLKLVRSLELDMARYFRALDMAIDWNALENLYYRAIKQ